MTKQITAEEIFRCNASRMAIGPSVAGYTLNYSVDGQNWTAYGEQVPAGEQCVVDGVVPSMYFKLAGNTDNVTVID